MNEWYLLNENPWTSESFSYIRLFLCALCFISNIDINPVNAQASEYVNMKLSEGWSVFVIFTN